MDIWVLDDKYETLGIVDGYISLIWSERYNAYGDVEIYMPASKDALDLLTHGRYLWRQDSTRYMIVETIEVRRDVEEGNRMTVTGRSLESILDRRVVWGQETVTDDANLQGFIQWLLTSNVISPENDKRRIPGFTFRASTDSRITALTINVQYLGENLYDVIEAICQAYSLGFRVLPFGEGGFVFELYMGTDRSDDQTAVPPVIFAPSFDNFLSSTFLSTLVGFKTATLVGGEGEGAERVLVEATTDDGGGSGLSRREVFTDARHVSSSTDDGELTPAEYEAQLVEAGKEALAEVATTTAFEGEIEPRMQFIYERDFFLGDIVQVRDEYGQESKSRVSELIRSNSTTDISVIPTFIAI